MPPIQSVGRGFGKGRCCLVPPEPCVIGGFCHGQIREASACEALWLDGRGGPREADRCSLALAKCDVSLADPSVRSPSYSFGLSVRATFAPRPSASEWNASADDVDGNVRRTGRFTRTSSVVCFASASHIEQWLISR